MTTSATTTVDVFQTLTLSGGTLSTGALVNNGAIDFQRGTLAVTGAGGFTIGTGAALGANVTLGTGSTLQVTNTATVAGGATLTLNGGTFTAGPLNVSGTLRATLGTASAASGTNNSGGRIFISDALDIASGGKVILDATAPAPAFAADGFVFENASVPEPGVGALLASMVWLWLWRRLPAPIRRRAA